MRRRPVVRIGRLDEAVSVQAHLLAVVLADVRVIPVHAGVGEAHASGEALADGHRLLRLMGSVVLVLEPKAVPVDRRLQIALVLGMDDDLRAFLHLQGRTGDGAVVGQHSHPAAGKVFDDRGDAEVELLPVAQLDGL